MSIVDRIKKWREDGKNQFNSLSDSDQQFITFLASWSQIFFIIGMVLIIYSYNDSNITDFIVWNPFFLLGSMSILIEMFLAIYIHMFMKQKIGA